MRMALNWLDTPIDYLNTTCTSTPLGDLVELEAVREAFDGKPPQLSSTKGLSGHSPGAASVHEALYCLLMLGGGFMAGSANIAEPDQRAEGFPVMRETRDETLRKAILERSGLCGQDGTLLFPRPLTAEPALRPLP